MSVRGEPRFTRDIDIAVAVSDDAAAERLVAELQSRGFVVRLVLELQALGRLATVRLLAPRRRPYIGRGGVGRLSRNGVARSSRLSRAWRTRHDSKWRPSVSRKSARFTTGSCRAARK